MKAYDRGFIEGLAYGRIRALTCAKPLDDKARRVRDHIDTVFPRAIEEAGQDPVGLRKRLLELWRSKLDRGAAEVVDLDGWRRAKAQRQPIHDVA
jgi:hypothetical protein